LVIYDGENGLGHWQLQRAAEVAAERAAINGIAAVGVGIHIVVLSGFTPHQLPRKGLVGIIFSNGPAVMPPWGGHTPVLSTSPIAAGIPTNPPTIIDMATSAVARGKIAAKAQSGEPLEPGWAFTADGQPTTDAKAALSGMLAPLGGAKGYALAVLVESLTGALIGPLSQRKFLTCSLTRQLAKPKEYRTSSSRSMPGNSRLMATPHDFQIL
jgi:(2R)-3-sulfolactate dehydrogenase (NADP+)